MRSYLGFSILVVAGFILQDKIDNIYVFLHIPTAYKCLNYHPTQKLMQVFQMVVIFWAFTPFSVFGLFQSFGSMYCLHLQGDRI
jgi:hypothetical protein